MIFLGYVDIEDTGALAPDYNVFSSSVPIANIDDLVIDNAIFDAIYMGKVQDLDYENGKKHYEITSPFTQPYSTQPSGWNEDTVLYAKFSTSGSLSAGSFDFNDSNIDYLNVKRRFSDDYGFQTVYSHQIIKDEEGKDIEGAYSFSFDDTSVRNNASYQYSIYPVVNGIEQVYSEASSITTDWDGLFIICKDDLYNAIMEVSVSSTRNKPTSIVQPINRKYPVVVTNGNCDYNTVDISALFVEFDSETCTFNFNEANQYREALYDCLHDSNAKLVKYEDGRMWLCSISGESITEDRSEHPDKVVTTVQFTEIGDCDDLEVLKTYGLSGLVGYSDEKDSGE